MIAPLPVSWSELPAWLVAIQPKHKLINLFHRSYRDLGCALSLALESSVSRGCPGQAHCSGSLFCPPPSTSTFPPNQSSSWLYCQSLWNNLHQSDLITDSLVVLLFLQLDIYNFLQISHIIFCIVLCCKQSEISCHVCDPPTCYHFATRYQTFQLAICNIFQLCVIHFLVQPHAVYPVWQDWPTHLHHPK